MPYTSPTITASGGTYAQAKAQGLDGRVAALITANTGLTADQIALINGLLNKSESRNPITRFKTLLSAWLKGDPISTADINSGLKDCTTALKANLAAMEEICVHVDANAGTLTSVQTGVLHAPRRTLA